MVKKNGLVYYRPTVCVLMKLQHERQWYTIDRTVFFLARYCLFILLASWSLYQVGGAMAGKPGAAGTNNVKVYSC